MTTALTTAQLSHRCDYWQRALRLQDWTVVARVARASQFLVDDEGPRAGQLQADLDHREAVVLVCAKEDYDAVDAPDYGRVQDMERTLVHELVHLLLWPLTSGLELTRLEQVAEEQAVNALADALVRLDRRER